MPDVVDISVKGKRKNVPAWQIGDVTVVKQGRFLKTAAIFDEYWLERDTLPNPEMVIAELREKEDKPDLFTFAQRVPEVEPKFNYYLEWDNVAVLPVSTYEHWFKNQTASSTRRNIRASKKRGIVVRVAEYNEEYIKGIVSIYNESPVRRRRKYWHYGKDFETVKKENGTFAWRSTFIAAYYQNEMIGYLKIVWDKNIGAIMQVLSKMEFWNKRPNNALLSEAVRQCYLRGANYLLYEKFNYGKKIVDTLTKYKQSNGFVRMNIPRYYIPLTKKGSLALRLGFHKDTKRKLPEWIMAPLRELRAGWYEWKMLR